MLDPKSVPILITPEGGLEPLALFTLKDQGHWREIRDFLRQGFDSQATPQSQNSKDICAELALAEYKLGNLEAATELAGRVLGETGGSDTDSIHKYSHSERTAALIHAAIFGQEQFEVDQNQTKVSRSVHELLDLAKSEGASYFGIWKGEHQLGVFKSKQRLFPAPVMSTSKTFAALAAFALVHDGKLNLDEPLHKYLELRQINAPLRADYLRGNWPELVSSGSWAEPPRSLVTVRHLLTHTSGLPGARYQARYGMSDQFFMGRASAVEAAALPLVKQPSAKITGSHQISSFDDIDYSNTAVTLLSPILSNAAGIPIDRYIKERIFLPLGFLGTHLNLVAEDNYGFAGDVRSTPDDLKMLGRLLVKIAREEGDLPFSRELAREFVRPSADFFAEGNPFCGHLVWLDRQYGVVRTSGYLGNDVITFPATGLVAVRMQDWGPQPSEYIQTRISRLSKISEIFGSEL